MKKLKITLLSLFTFAAFSLTAFAQNSDPSVIGVKMDAEWCGKCQVLNPKLSNVMPEFEDSEILFVFFDMTNDFTTQQAGFLANRLGLTDLYNEHKGRTGYMVLLNAETGEVLHTLQSDQSEEELKKDIKSVLQSVRS